MSFFARTVLSLMDDALYIYQVAGKGVEFIESVPWDRADFTSYVAQDLLMKRCKGAPVSVLHDGIEQYYRKERVFTAGVGTLDKQAMVNRKLAMVFPSHSTRVAIDLKEKVQQTGSKMPSDIYMFSAVPSSESLALVMAVLRKAPVLSFGLSLLPLEAISLVDDLADKAIPKDGKGKWTLLIGQHRNGNLRQIVVKDGQLALTRMTQIAKSENDNAQEWAQDVAQEFQSTMNYLARLGFQQAEGLDVIFISSDDNVSLVRSGIESQYNFYGLTAQQAAKLLNVKLADTNGLFADGLHVANLAKKLTAKVSLPLPSLDPIIQGRWAVSAAIVVLGISAIFFCQSAVSSYLSGASLRDNISRQETRLRSVRSQYDAQAEKMLESGVDLPLIQATVGVYNQLNRSELDVFNLIRVSAGSIQSKGLIESFDLTIAPSTLEIVDENASPVVGATNDLKPAYELLLVVKFEDDINDDLGNEDLRAIRNDLRDSLPDHDVKITRFLGDVKPLSNVLLKSRGLSADKIAQLSIKGAAIND